MSALQGEREELEESIEAIRNEMSLMSLPNEQIVAHEEAVSALK